ncbi:MAG: type I polyketide synthase [Phormidesmis sp.]
MKFGLMFFASSEAGLTRDKYRLVFESARFGDRHGFSSLWTPERHFTQFGNLYPNPALLKAALARETQHIRLQAGSVVLPLHSPLQLAEDWAMVDNLSGGRVGISFASGWNPDDFVSCPENYPNRHQVLFEGIQTIRQLWRGEALQATSGSGKPIQIRTYPTPIQPELPIWVTAAGNPKTFAKAGKLGANLLTHLLDQGVDTLAEKISLYRQSRAEQGYSPESGTVTVMLHTFVGQQFDQVRELARDPYCRYLKANVGLVKGLAQSRGRTLDINTLSEQDLDEFLNFLFERFAFSRGLIGTPDTCLDLIEQLDRVGVDEVACLLDFGPSDELILEHLPYLHQLKERYAVANSLAASARSSQLDSQAQAPQQRSEETKADLEQSDSSIKETLSEVKTRCQNHQSGADFYTQLNQYGIQLGERFQGIENLWLGQGEALAEVQLSSPAEGHAFKVDPALLNACNQVLGAALWQTSAASRESLFYLPIGFRSFKAYQPLPQRVWSHAILQPSQSTAAVDRPQELIEGQVRIFDSEDQLLAEVSGLQMRQAQPPSAANEPLSTNWFYDIQWQPQSPSAATVSAAKPGSWLIFADRQGVGQQLVEQLESQGTVCWDVSYAAVYGVSDRHFWLNPADPVHMQQLFEDLIQAGQAWAQAVHLWSLDATPSAQTTLTSLKHDQTRSVASSLHLLQRLAQQTSPPDLWLITRGTQPIGTASTSLSVAQAPLWGLGRVAALEYPHLKARLVDLDFDAAPDEAAQQLLAAVQNADQEDQIAYRQGQRYVARLKPAPQPEAPSNSETTPLAIRSDATYLITGGLGGLGLEIAAWMAEQGARHLVLVSRRPVKDPQQLKPLKDLGVNVVVAQADVTEIDAVERVLSQIRQSHPPLSGVIHLAGILDDALLSQETWSHFARVAAPKVEGSWVLHSLTQTLPLDFFLMFSSAASLLGQMGQANYVAANRFLDSLAHYRRAQGLPALSINWGPWAEAGHATTAYGRQAHQQIARQGIESLRVKQGLAVLADLLRQPAIAQVGVIPINWSMLFQADPTFLQAAFLSELVPSEQGQSSPEKTQLLAQLQSAPESERSHILQTHVQDQIAQLMGLDAAQVDMQQPLNTMGLDSLMAVELRNQFQSALGVNIPLVKLIEGISVAGLVSEVNQQLSQLQTGAETDASEAADQPLDDRDNNWIEVEL